MLVDKMYGSSCIVDRAIKLGHKARLVTFGGYKHSPHVNPSTKALNDSFFVIQEMMSDFFFDIVTPQKPEIVEENDHYYLKPYPLEASWKVDGGVILDSNGNSIEVAWIGNAPQHSITVSTLLPYGLGLNTTQTFN
jgi:hypothetical protein